jgi:DNA-binding CsgD family transcriptional regulator
MTTSFRKTGLPVLGEMSWGSHCCHFFQTRRDLLDTLLPYFKVGLEARELCVWITHAPVTEAVARQALRLAVPGADRYLADGSIEIVSSGDWYLKGGRFSLERVMRAWDARLDQAAARGYTGMRANGNSAWLERKSWKSFSEYEVALNEAIVQKPMILICSYDVKRCGAVEVLDVARSHQFAIAKRLGTWEVIEWTQPSSSPDHYETLTTRERQVLLLAAEGHTNPEIAGLLSIGVRTVESHRASLMRKLGLRNQTDLVRYALRRGLLSRDERGKP